MIGISLIIFFTGVFIYKHYRFNSLERMQKRYHKIHGEVFINLFKEAETDISAYHIYDKVSKQDKIITRLIINNSQRKLKIALSDYYRDFGKYSETYQIDNRDSKIDKILN